MGDRVHNADISDPRELIRQAFFTARERGKPDWFQMTAGVLKNRLLLATSGRFHESEYGAASFTEFLRAFPDLVLIDMAAGPPRVILKEFSPEEGVDRPVRLAASRTRIRPDLWQAIVDFSSGIQYGWDVHAKRARPVNQEESDDVAVMPTITPDELKQWRRDFLASHPSAAEEGSIEAERLNSWAEHILGTAALPMPLRGQWNQEMNRRVEGRLREWFETQQLDAPSDLVEKAAAEREPVPTPGDLRALALDVVTHMTNEELRALSFPAEAVVRALRRRG